MSTLYANENPQIWNPETDEMKSVNAEQDEELAIQAIEEGRVLAQLKGHSGFKLLEEYLLGSIEDLTHRLTLETDYKKFRRLQEAVKAYNNVLGFVDFKIHEGKALEQTRTPEEQK